MSKGNPSILLRAPEASLAAWGHAAKLAGLSTQEWLRRLANEALEAPRQVAPAPAPAPSPHEPKVPENRLARAARLRAEYADIERDFPQLAREIGSFEEYVSRQP